MANNGLQATRPLHKCSQTYRALTVIYIQLKILTRAQEKKLKEKRIKRNERRILKCMLCKNIYNVNSEYSNYKKLRIIWANVKEKEETTGLVIQDTWCSLHLKLYAGKAAKIKIHHVICNRIGTKFLNQNGSGKTSLNIL